MEIKFIQKKKGVVQLEFDDKVLPNALVEVLSQKGVDAYVYEPHPLMPYYGLHVEASDAMKELKSALDEVEKDWKEFGKLLVGGLKAGK
jgi:DNA-directed RNA polymerase subunit L